MVKYYHITWANVLLLEFDSLYKLSTFYNYESCFDKERFEQGRGVQEVGREDYGRQVFFFLKFFWGWGGGDSEWFFLEGIEKSSVGGVG